MILPVALPPTDLTRYIPMEQVEPMAGRYPAFITETPTEKEFYEGTTVNKETKLGSKEPLNSANKDSKLYEERKYQVAAQQSEGYSEEFLGFQTESFVRQVLRNLDVWANDGTDDAIPQIANIKQLLQQYEQYLAVNKESRMMLAGLELVFENNAWENLPSDKVHRLKNIFSRFENNIEINDVKTFMRELHTQKISVMAKNYEETQEKK